MYLNIFEIIAACFLRFHISIKAYIECYVYILSCFYLLWNFLFLAGSGLKYGVNVYHILKFCQPRTIGNEMVWGLQCEEYSFLTPLKNTKITHFTQHWTTVYARNVPHIMVLHHIMNPGIHEDVSSFCVSNDIIIILHLQWEWH